MTLLIFNATARVTVNTANLSQHTPTCARAWDKGWHVNNDCNVFTASDGTQLTVSPYGFINTEQPLSQQVIDEAAAIFTQTFETMSSTSYQPCLVALDTLADKKQLIETCFLTAEHYYMSSASQPSLANRSANALLAMTDRLNQITYHENTRIPYFDKNINETTTWNMIELLRQQAIHLRALTYRARKRSVAWRLVKALYLSLVPIVTTLFGWFAFQGSPIGAVLFGGFIPIAVFLFLENEDEDSSRIYVPELPAAPPISLTMSDVTPLTPQRERGLTATVWKRLCYRAERFKHRWLLGEPHF